MTKIDYDLVYLISENARMNLKEIASNLRKSPQRVKYNLKVLEREKIIREPYCIFDYSYLGLLLFKVYFRGAYSNTQEKERIINELKKNPYVVSIYELNGEYDLVVEFSAPNPSRFNKELKKISDMISAYDYKIILNVVTHLYPRNYLTKKENLKKLNFEKIVGGDRPVETFDIYEFKIMNNLLLNPLIKYTHLAKKSDLNVKTAKSILKKLIKKNIIKGFRYVISGEKLKIYRSRLILRLHNITPEKDAELLEYVRNIEEISQLNKTVGDWDMEIDIESQNRDRIREIVADLRDKFKDIIERFSIIEFYELYQRKYLPMFLFEKEVK